MVTQGLMVTVSQCVISTNSVLQTDDTQLLKCKKDLLHIQKTLKLCHETYYVALLANTRHCAAKGPMKYPAGYASISIFVQKAPFGNIAQYANMYQQQSHNHCNQRQSRRVKSRSASTHDVFYLHLQFLVHHLIFLSAK